MRKINIGTFEDLMENEKTILNPHVMSSFLESCNNIKDLCKAEKYLEDWKHENNIFMKSFNCKIRMRFFEKRSYKNFTDENESIEYWINLLRRKIIKLIEFSQKTKCQ